MRIGLLSRVVLTLLVVPAFALAQRDSGANISTGLGLYSSTDFVLVHWGPPDSIQLVAAVLFRGSSPLGRTVSPDTASIHFSLDSASAVARARGRLAGGAILPRAAPWIEYDERTSTLFALNREWQVPRADSALVLLVDRIDHVGGEPTVEPVMVPVHPTEDSADAMYAHWEIVLRANDRVRAFMDGR